MRNLKDIPCDLSNANLSKIIKIFSGLYDNAFFDILKKEGYEWVNTKEEYIRTRDSWFCMYLDDFKKCKTLDDAMDVLARILNDMLLDCKLKWNIINPERPCAVWMPSGLKGI